MPAWCAAPAAAVNPDHRIVDPRVVSRSIAILTAEARLSPSSAAQRSRAWHRATGTSAPILIV